MPKVFRSDIEASFFKYLSQIWSRLPQDDRDLLVEYWRGLLRASSDEYTNYLQVEAASGILTISPYEVRKWRPIRIRNTPELKSEEDDGWLKQQPSAKPNAYHLEQGTLRAEHLYRSAQALYIPITNPVADPVAYTFEADLRFPIQTAVDEVMMGYADPSAVGRGSVVALSFGKLAPKDVVVDYFQNRSQQTIGRFVAQDGQLLSFSTASRKLHVLSTTSVRVDNTNFNNLLTDPDKTYFVAIYDSASGNNGAYKVLGISSTVFAGDTLTLEGTLAVEASLNYDVYPSVGGGITSSGFATGNAVVNAVVDPQDLATVTLLGGQAGVKVSAGLFNAVRLHLDHLSNATPGGASLAFHVYRSSSNFSASYERITEANTPIVPVYQPSIGAWEIRFSEIGMLFNDGDWIKIRPVDLATEYEFLDIVTPMRVVRSSLALREDWATQAPLNQPFALKLALSDSSGVYETLSMYAVELPVGFDFGAYHNYRVETTGGYLTVYVDNVARNVLGQSRVEYLPSDARTLSSFGFFGLEQSQGLRYFAKNVKYTGFDIDERIAELPALYDRYERQALILEHGEHYSINPRGTLIFNSLDVAGGSIRGMDVMVAEYVSYAMKRIESSYGIMVGVSGEDSPEMRNKTQAVWSALLDGPQISSLVKGVQAILGLPVTTIEGFVTAEPNSDSSIEVDGILYRFSAPVGVGVNPRTGQRYKKGDYVPAFSALAGGVVVRDYMVQRDWWYDLVAQARIHELQKYHTFEIEIDNRLLTSDAVRDVSAFVDRIRMLGDNFTIVGSEEVVDSLVIESNFSRTQLLEEDQDRVFVGDSSDPAVVCTPYVTSTLTPNTLGWGHMGGVDFTEAQSLLVGTILEPYITPEALNTGGFGDPDPAFADVTALTTGSNGVTAVNNVFNSAGATFLTDGVRAGDFILLKNTAEAGLYTVTVVNSETQLEVHTTVLQFETVQTGVVYEVYRLVSTDTVAQSSFFIGGIPVREGAYLQLQADNFDETRVQVGIEPTPPGGGPAMVQIEDLLAAMYYGNDPILGESRIPGAFAYIEQLRIDPRDFNNFAPLPRRLCIRTVSTKGHNSKIVVTESDGSLDLSIAATDYRGHITYPGRQHIGSGTEPYSLPYRSAYKDGNGNLVAVPIGEIDERQDALYIAGKGDPGADYEFDLYLNDGTTIRRDIAAVDTDGHLQFPKALNYNDLTTGQPYQAPFANGAQFGTFYSDYVTPTEEYPVAFSGATVLANSRISVPQLASLPQLHSSPNGYYLAPDVFQDVDADFTRMRIGDRLVIGADTYRVAGNVDQTRLKLAIATVQVTATNVVRFTGIDPVTAYALTAGDTFRITNSSAGNDGVYTVQSISGSDVTITVSTLTVELAAIATVDAGNPMALTALNYVVRGAPAAGDYVFIEALNAVDPVDRSLYPVFEGDILVIKGVYGQELTLQRYDAAGVLQDVVLQYASSDVPFDLDGKIVRSPLPYSLNNAIAFSRTHRVNKGYVVLGDDLRMAEDTVEVEFL